jgi:hypothetical protein
MKIETTSIQQTQNFYEEVVKKIFEFLVEKAQATTRPDKKIKVFLLPGRFCYH